ncbi:MAG: DUF1697 domain-containing protein [Methanobrevibacter sp.]|nr:DUF1697 domain-containing protein [Methanobrevibacter sp.]
MKYVAFLRGINVGKNKLILMDDLKVLFSKMGFTKVKTYLRSGNIIFESDDLNIDELSDKISNNIEEFFGFYVDCFIKSENEINSLIKNNPYDNNLSEEIYLSIFKEDINEKLSKELIDEFKNLVTNDEFVIAEKEIYLLCRSKYHKTKFNNNFFESKLENIATTRNWKTMIKIKHLLS